MMGVVFESFSKNCRLPDPRNRSEKVNLNRLRQYEGSDETALFDGKVFHLSLKSQNREAKNHG